MKHRKPPSFCAYCGEKAQGNYSIHRDGLDQGPEVDLCDRCGSGPTPACEEIWAKIRHPAPPLDAGTRANLRDAIAQWTAFAEKTDPSKMEQLLLALAEDALIFRLAPLCPNPRKDLFTGLAGAFFGEVAGLLNIPLGHIAVTINEPPEHIEAKMIEFERLLNTADADQDRLRALSAELEPYVLVLPFAIYKRACEINLHQWAFSMGSFPRPK